MSITNYFGPQLVIIENINGQKIIRKEDIKSQQILIGRTTGERECHVKLNSPLVSSLHGMVTNYNGRYYYNDCGSTNGTFVNGRHIRSQNGQMPPAVEIKDGSILSIGSKQNKNEVYMIFSINSNEQRKWNYKRTDTNCTITVGRALDNDICVPNVTASRSHANINCTENSVVLIDNNSVNGTFVNGTIVKKCILNDGDIIYIGASKLYYVDNIIVYNEFIIEDEEKPNDKPDYGRGKIRIGEGIEVTVKDITKTVKCKKGNGINGGNTKNILEHITLTIDAGDFVAICGGSGAGKTTFMNCINGFEPATSGEVLVNGTDLYKNYSQLKNQIGYVPQQDIVHDNLTLESMLTYTAKLRLQSDISKDDIIKTVDEVLKMVDLGAQRDTFIKKLSGGQRKRASIAVELVSDPSLFFLDEPTSGLDPEAETHLMHRLKDLSDEKGKTVIVITHTLQNIHLFDKVLFLAPGGKLCFYGPPEEAKKFFGVDNLADAYEKISENIDGYVNKFRERQKEEMR